MRLIRERLLRGTLVLAAAIFAAGGAGAATDPGAGAATDPGAASDPGAGGDSLVVLHTNDTHARLAPFERDDGVPAGGAAARAAVLARERGRAGRTLFLDAGDVFQGTPYFNFFRGIPDYRVMTMMGYDAGALGNHDLDDGPAAWLRASAEAKFEILSANVFVSAESSWAQRGPEVSREIRRGARWVGGGRVPEGVPLRFLAPPHQIRTLEKGLRVALLGLTTSDLTHIVTASRNAGVAVSDPIAVARHLVPELRENADVVICITHMGVDQDRKLAEQVPGIDLIIGGHSHTRLYHPILVRNENANGYEGTVVAQTGYRGEFLGRTVIYLQGSRPVRYTGSLIPVLPSEGEEERVAAFLRPYADSIRVLMARPVFRSPVKILSSGLREGETPLGNFVADVIREATGADLAIMNSGGIRAGLPAGKITVGDVYTTLPFDNTLVVLTMTARQVQQLLDFAARRLGKGGFAQVSGVSFTIQEGRAVSIRVNGKSLDPDRLYRVATIDFLYGGGDGYTVFGKASKALETGILLRDAAVQFLLERPDYVFRTERRIRQERSIGETRGSMRR